MQLGLRDSSDAVPHHGRAVRAVVVDKDFVVDVRHLSVLRFLQSLPRSGESRQSEMIVYGDAAEMYADQVVETRFQLKRGVECRVSSLMCEGDKDMCGPDSASMK